MMRSTSKFRAMNSKTPGNHSEAPDGGWGWFVVLSSFLSHTFIIGTVKSFGVYFPYFQEAFGQDAASTAWVSSIQGAVMLFGSLPAGALSNAFGCRTVVMTGSLVATTGLISSMFVTSLPVMYLTAGFVTGVGFSFMYTPCITMVGRYFKNRRALANGLGLSGSGVGNFALPPVFQLLIDSYGWRGSLFILAGLALQGSVFGALLRPIYLKSDIKVEDTHQLPNDAPRSRKTTCGLLARLYRVLDLSLFRMPYFVIFTSANMFLLFGYSVPFVHLVKHARNLGIEPQQAAFLVSVIGISDGLSRIAYGWFSDLGLFPLFRGFIVCSLGLGLSLMLLPFAQTYPTMVVCCLSVGTFVGCVATQTAVFLAELCGVKRLASALGIAYSARGFSMLLGPPVAGRLYDITGNYNVSWYVAGGTVLLCTVMLTALEVHRTRNVQQPSSGIPEPDDEATDSQSEDTDDDIGVDDSNNPLTIHETSI